MTGSDPAGRVDAEGAVLDAVARFPFAGAFGAAVIVPLRGYRHSDREQTPHNYYNSSITPNIVPLPALYLKTFYYFTL